MKLTPTTRNSGATVEVGKGNSLTAVNSGSASEPIALALGENVITVKVTAADGTTTKTYTVTVTRGSDTGRPTNVRLTSGNGSVTVTWDQAVGGPLARDVTVTHIEYGEVNSNDQASVTGVRQSAVYSSRLRTGRSWSVSGLTNGKIYAFRLRLPAYGEVPASVWTSWYYINLLSQPSNDAILSSLEGEWLLSDNWVAINFYPLFSPSTTYYSAGRNYDVNLVSHIRLTPTTRNSGATVEVGKGNSLTAVNSGSASGLIALTPGENVVTVKVTAEDGTTTKTYTLLVLMDDTPLQAQSTDATLSGLTASSHTGNTGTFTTLTLNPSTFASGTTAYTATVANERTHVKLTPTVNDSNARVKVGKGSSLTAVTSGSASGAIALDEGENTITVEVTAEDRSATKTYTVTVTRA